MRLVEYECHVCKEQFDLLGDMERHILLEHLQERDIAPAKLEESRQSEIGKKEHAEEEA
jgi:hypothetical protein